LSKPDIPEQRGSITPPLKRSLLSILNAFIYKTPEEIENVSRLLPGGVLWPMRGFQTVSECFKILWVEAEPFLGGRVIKPGSSKFGNKDLYSIFQNMTHIFVINNCL
jgi:hypothetical protein